VFIYEEAHYVQHSTSWSSTIIYKQQKQGYMQSYCDHS